MENYALEIHRNRTHSAALLGRGTAYFSTLHLCEQNGQDIRSIDDVLASSVISLNHSMRTLREVITGEFTEPEAYMAKRNRSEEERHLPIVDRNDFRHNLAYIFLSKVGTAIPHPNFQDRRYRPITRLQTIVTMEALRFKTKELEKEDADVIDTYSGGHFNGKDPRFKPLLRDLFLAYNFHRTQFNQRASKVITAGKRTKVQTKSKQLRDFIRSYDETRFYQDMLERLGSGMIFKLIKSDPDNPNMRDRISESFRVLNKCIMAYDLRKRREFSSLAWGSIESIVNRQKFYDDRARHTQKEIPLDLWVGGDVVALFDTPYGEAEELAINKSMRLFVARTQNPIATSDTSSEILSDIVRSVKEAFIANKMELTDKERFVLMGRFPILSPSYFGPQEPVILADIGKPIGITTIEGARLAQNTGLKKIRKYLKAKAKVSA